MSQSQKERLEGVTKKEILAWIATEKKAKFPDKAALKQAVRDLEFLSDDFRVTSHGEGCYNQKRNYL